MNGDAAPLKDLADFCEAKSLILIVDEAHGIGVFGDRGEGLVQFLKIEDKVPVRIITFGKAIGAHGAAILSNLTIKNFLINFCRSFIYTTALPPYSIQSLSNSYLALKNGHLTIQLKENIRLFKAQFNNIESKNIISSDSSIQCVLFPGNDVVRLVSDFLITAGFYVKPVLSPTVKKGKERVRICIHTFNTDNQIINLANAIKLQIAQARN